MFPLDSATGLLAGNAAMRTGKVAIAGLAILAILAAKAAIAAGLAVPPAKAEIARIVRMAGNSAVVRTAWFLGVVVENSAAVRMAWFLGVLRTEAAAPAVLLVIFALPAPRSQPA